MNIDAIAPRADGLDTIVGFAEFELRVFQALADLRQSIEQRATVRNDQAGDAAEDVGSSYRQMKLSHADIDPHVAGAGIDKRVARETKAGNVIMRRQMLIGDADIHVADIDDVAKILGGTIILLSGMAAFLPVQP